MQGVYREGQTFVFMTQEKEEMYGYILCKISNYIIKIQYYSGLLSNKIPDLWVHP